MPSKRPQNFSWVVDGLLAGSAIPWERGHFQFYLDHNIKTLVTLTEFKPPMQYAPPELNHIFMPIVEFEAPSVPQIEEFCQLVEESKKNDEALCVHCHWGRGRTGVMLAAYLVGYHEFSPRRAIEAIRQSRPYSIETYEQEDAVFDFAEYMHMKQAEEMRKLKEMEQNACEKDRNNTENSTNNEDESYDKLSTSVEAKCNYDEAKAEQSSTSHAQSVDPDRDCSFS